MRLFIDIETCPTTDPAIIAGIAAGITPPGNLSKAETIAAWERDKKPAAIAEAVNKTALDAATGSIIAIGMATDDGEPLVLTRDPADESDADLLRRAFNHLSDCLNAATPISPTDGSRMYRPDPYLVGHNVAFDLGFLWRRAVIHGVIPDFTLPSPDAARHGKNCFCTMQHWAGYGQRISLSRLSRALGLPDPKQNADGISGANAWNFWREGDVAMVKTYCAADVIAARSIFQRMEAMTAREAA